MYHYTECGLSNVFLKNGFVMEQVDGENYTSIDDINNLHNAIAQSLTDNHTALCPAEFKFLRIELNLSQKMLGYRFGVSEQTIARYEKGQSVIPRTTDAALRSLFMETLEKASSVGYFLDLLSDAEAKQAAREILLEEVDNHWKIAV
ncbi:helix-turn-helix domain-containing protein [Marinomonas sp. IMCC 4694]|uniref:helix-turn-helix domain-containing protein n=1 Tax=Marinomonas sp. IMCC 4694 TaxID=2605432 RepID=UPI0011E7F12D|nr:helix-turn-helix domain-containing protein [Marinomonas sp. IMCC 4694]TYL46512.1 helix-turn-helix domain-containing protein [Marinomonas sp. IMCC 4694]